MNLEYTTADIEGNLEYPACPLCGTSHREFSFRLNGPYKIACCAACGLHYLHPRLTETAIREAYQQSSYYEGGTCGYADTSYNDQERALRATFKRLFNNLHRRGLAGGGVFVGWCGYGWLAVQESACACWGGCRGFCARP